MSKQRKNSSTFNTEHSRFIDLANSGLGELEIMHELDLSISQYRKHLHDAAVNGELQGAPRADTAVWARSLPGLVRRLLNLEAKEAGGTLVKLEICDTSLILTPVLTPQRDEQEKNPLPYDEDADTAEEHL